MNASPAKLPELPDDRVDALERSVFARIGDERSAAARRRRYTWFGGAAAAAVLVVAVVIAPSVVSRVSFGGASESTVAGPTTIEPAPAPDVDVEAPIFGGGSAEDAAGTDPALVPVGEGAREITTTASASVTVDDVATAARAIGDDAETRGGYVESLNLDARDAASGSVPGSSSGTGSGSGSGSADGFVVEPYPYPYPPHDGASVTVRIPSTELDAALAALDDLGSVTASSVNRQDVTDQAVDLRARVAASEASVLRLTELIGQATSVADLIAAESALAERQATLESDRRQLELLEGQVALSSLSVQLTPVTETLEADPAGFGDGIAAGWNGLVATLNGIVIALGFLLPWIAVVAALAALAWAITRGVQRLRASGGPHKVEAGMSTRAAAPAVALNVGDMNADDKTRIAAGEGDKLPPAPHGLSEEDAVRKDRSYSPASETETAQKQQPGLADTVDDDIDPDQVQVAPGTGGPDDVGEIEVDPDDLNMPGRS